MFGEVCDVTLMKLDSGFDQSSKTLISSNKTFIVLSKFSLSVIKRLVTLIKTCLDGSQSEVGIGNYLYSSFPLTLKQRDALSPPLFNFAVEFAIRKVTRN